MIPTMETTVTEAEDDFADLDCIIAEDEAKRAATRAQGAKQKRLAKGGLTDADKAQLLLEVRAYEALHSWTTVAAVALFHTQECLSCQHKHRFFMGWMTQQDHKRDPNCRRLIRGRPPATVPARVEEHAQPAVELCSDCCESGILIEQALGRANAEAEARQLQEAIAAHRQRQLKQEQQNG